tara:strand:- start:1807 stop:2496 length:690 start_codon:yes stop_codon:yes gene_type:complete
MEFIEDFKGLNNTFTKKIKDSIFVEQIKTEQKISGGFVDICQVIIQENDLEYSSQQESHKNIYTKNKKIQISEMVVKNDAYVKSFSPSLIQNGLQHPNHLSSILHLNELYKINCVIYNPSVNKYFKTSLKNYAKLICIYKNNKWFFSNDNIEDHDISDFEESGIENILTIDTDFLIFKPHLQNISKYKLDDLLKICSDEGIETLKENGKKKLKKDLYNEINLKHYQQDI